jgi:hypothetical protein
LANYPTPAGACRVCCRNPASIAAAFGLGGANVGYLCALLHLLLWAAGNTDCSVHVARLDMSRYIVIRCDIGARVLPLRDDFNPRHSVSVAGGFSCRDADRIGAIARVPGRLAVVFDMRCATPPGVTPCWFPTLSALVKPRATQFSIVSEPPGETNHTLWAPKPAPSSIKPLLRRAVSSRRAAHSSRESRAPMDFPAGVTTSMTQRR